MATRLGSLLWLILMIVVACRATHAADWNGSSQDRPACAGDLPVVTPAQTAVLRSPLARSTGANVTSQRARSADEWAHVLAVSQASVGDPGSLGLVRTSDVAYPGASTSRPFVAQDPYVLQIMGVRTPVSLGRAPRTYDFSGDVPFINPATDRADAGTMQGWDRRLGGSRTIVGDSMTNEGFTGNIEKRNGMTMVRYVAGDGVTAGKCRTQLNGYAIPPRTQARWELTVAFGADDGENNWVLTPPKESPVLFWQTKSHLGANPSMSAVVDTDPADSTRSLILYFYRKGGRASAITPVASVHGIPRNTLVPIVIEAFLDEREPHEGGEGQMNVSVGGNPVGTSVGPTLTWGQAEHNWAISTYLYEEARPYRYTRAAFFRTARMFVHPSN